MEPRAPARFGSLHATGPPAPLHVRCVQSPSAPRTISSTGGFPGANDTGRPRGSLLARESTVHALSTVRVSLPKLPFFGVLPSKSTYFFSIAQPFLSKLALIVV